MPDKAANLVLSRILVAAGALSIALFAPWFEPGIDADMAISSFLEPPILSGCNIDSATEITDWNNITGADQRLRVNYQCSSVRMSLDVARFIVQKEGKEAVTDTNVVVHSRLLSAPLHGLHTMTSGLKVRAFAIDRGSRPGSLWTWYAVGDTPAARPIDAKLLEVRSALVLQRPVTSILTLVVWSEDSASNESLLERAAAEVWAWYLQREGA